MGRHGRTYGRALNVGSKSVRITPDCVNLDIVGGPEVDIVGDAHALGSVFEPESFDTVVLAAVLQYCERPHAVIAQAAHVLKPRGTLLIDAPFLQPYCRDRDDLWRFTVDGLRYLCRQHFDVLEATTAIPAGPALAFAAEAALRGTNPSAIGRARAAIGAWAMLPLKYMRAADTETAGAILMIASKRDVTANSAVS